MNAGADREQDPTKQQDSKFDRALHETTDGPLAELESDSIPSPVSDRYDLKRLQATGGMGRVWLAYDKQLGRAVALKDLRPELAGNANMEARFLHEAHITGRLEHPGIVPVYELSDQTERGLPFYTMRFLKGRTLAEAVDEYHRNRERGTDESFDFIELVNAFVTVCKTVAFAHSQGVVHRDLKGHNVILGDFGDVVLLDWGLAKEITANEPKSTSLVKSGNLALDDQGLTILGQAVGTPSYMAPEQAAGQSDLIDRRTDVYGLGALLYEILTGQPPFVGLTKKEILRKVQNQEVTPPRQLNKLVPALLEHSCLKALSKEPGARYSSASEFAYEVERWQEVQRRQTEKALQVSEAMYQSLVDALPMGLVRKDLEGKIVFVNDKSATLFGRSPKEIVGKTVAHCFPEMDAELIRKEDTTVIRTGEVVVDVFDVVIDGKTAYFISRKGPVRNEKGETIGVQSIFWDVTEQRTKELELLAERDQLRKALILAQAKHQNTP